MSERVGKETGKDVGKGCDSVTRVMSVTSVTSVTSVMGVTCVTSVTGP